MKKLKPGDKVYYIPFENCPPYKITDGVIKSIPDHTDKEVRVVFNCNQEWDNYQDYTSQLTRIDQLELGWFHTKEDFDIIAEALDNPPQPNERLKEAKENHDKLRSGGIL
jgi:hypothetical protein